MNFLIEIFNTLLYQPLFNALIWLYNILPGHDFGIAVIVLTIITRFVLYPLMIQSIKSQKALKELQPKIKAVQEKYKDNKEEQTKAMMDLYKREKINPLGGCLPLLIQFPLLIAMFWVFRAFEGGISIDELSVLYPFVSAPTTLGEPMFLGMINLANSSMFLAVIAGIVQFFQTKMMTGNKEEGKQGNKKEGQMAGFSSMFQKQMLYLFPIFTIFILSRASMPSAVGLYWIAGALFSIVQQYLVLKQK